MPKRRKKKTKRYPELFGLKGAIRENGTSYVEVAQELGIGTHTLSDKINGYYCFNTEEIEQLVSLLNIEAGNVLKIFFPNMLKFSA